MARKRIQREHAFCVVKTCIRCLTIKKYVYTFYKICQTVIITDTNDFGIKTKIIN